MKRLQWLLLALAVAGAAVLVASWDRGADDTSASVSSSGGGEPDLYMQNAVISQFGAAGDLRYQLRAAEISYFADRRVTRLHAPALSLLRSDGPPWVAAATNGEVAYSDSAKTALPDPLARAPVGVTAGMVSMAGETVQLTDGVVLSRTDGHHYMRLTTDRLTVLPTTRTARTTAAVLIVTDTGRTIATGMAGELDTGRLQLFSDPRQRVTTIVHSLQH